MFLKEQWTLLLLLYSIAHTRYGSEREIVSSQIPVPDYKQQSQETKIHTTGGIQTHNPSKRATADIILRSRGYPDQVGTLKD